MGFWFRRLDGNNFLCDCAMKWFINYVKEETFQISAGHCSEPGSLSQKSVLELSEDILCGKQFANEVKLVLELACIEEANNNNAKRCLSFLSLGAFLESWSRDNPILVV